MGKAFHVSYEDKTKLVAYTQQVKHGVYDKAKITAVGYLDVIGQVSIARYYFPNVVYVSGKRSDDCSALFYGVSPKQMGGIQYYGRVESHICC